MRMAFAAALAALTLTSPAFAQGQQPPRPSTISVSGAGEAELKPNFARLNVAVSTQADTIGQASDANRASTEKVLARLQAIGVKKEDIRTLNFQVFQTPPRVGPDGKEIRVPKFTANHELRITTRDLDGVGKLAGEILASPDMLFESVSFGLDRQEEGEDKAREAAVRDAKRKAELYAAAAGVTLVKILEIEDGAARPYGAPEDSFRMRAAPMMKEAGEAIPIVPPATLRYDANVQMVWEIAPK
ncbi:SIMPL domain-containing protein [Microvirga flavescens]|uniref:SIMPL domain-containing protein n=1 Tax=Microvirga flavescens TaxID=2249811 RepID=UPI000DD6E95E|nr:SIMPL domain-containing protein [Microvirga flavescens]